VQYELTMVHLTAIFPNRSLSYFLFYSNSEPIANLYDCQGSRAYLRINLKRYILQKYYDINVSYMAVAVIHPLLETHYEIYEAPLLEQEAIRVIQKIRKHSDNSHHEVTV
jgi:hypothetical protein